MFIEIFKVSLGQIKSDLCEVRNNIWRSEVKLKRVNTIEKGE